MTPGGVVPVSWPARRPPAPAWRNPLSTAVTSVVESGLACQKALFQLEEDAHFLNCAYLGPLPRSVAEAGVEGIRRKCSPTPFPSEAFFTDCERARERFGRLVNAPPERVALHPSASYGIEVAARNLPLEPGQNIVGGAGERHIAPRGEGR